MGEDKDKPADVTEENSSESGSTDAKAADTAADAAPDTKAADAAGDDDQSQL